MTFQNFSNSKLQNCKNLKINITSDKKEGKTLRYLQTVFAFFNYFCVAYPLKKSSVQTKASLHLPT